MIKNTKLLDPYILLLQETFFVNSSTGSSNISKRWFLFYRCVHYSSAQRGFEVRLACATLTRAKHLASSLLSISTWAREDIYIALVGFIRSRGMF